MNVRWYDRILIALSGLVLIAVGGCIILAAGGVLVLPEPIAFDSWLGNGWQWMPLVFAVGILVVIWGLYLFLRAFMRGKEAGGKYYTLQNEEDGNVRISVSAINRLVHKCLDKYSQIIGAKVRIGGREDAMRITMHMTLESDVRIPELLSEVREDIKLSLQQSAGVTVQTVQMYVDSTKDDKHKDGVKYIEAKPATAREAREQEDYVNTASFYTTPVVVTREEKPAETEPMLVNEPTVAALKKEVDLGPEEPLPVDLSAQAFPFPEEEAGVPLEIYTADIPLGAENDDGEERRDV